MSRAVEFTMAAPDFTVRPCADCYRILEPCEQNRCTMDDEVWALCAECLDELQGEGRRMVDEYEVEKHQCAAEEAWDAERDEQESRQCSERI